MIYLLVEELPFPFHIIRLFRTDNLFIFFIFQIELRY